MKKRVLWLLFLILLCGCQNNGQGQEENNSITPQIMGSTENIEKNIQTLTPTVEPTKAALTPTAEPTKAVLTPTAEPTETIVTPTAEPTKTPDVQAPVIEGLSDKTVYTGETISYKKGIKVTDDTDDDVTLEIDTSLVDLDTPGEYTVTYTATDAAGNVTRESITVLVLILDSKEAEVDRLADVLLKKLITEDMSKWDICYKLWNWCRTNIQYAYSAGDRSSVYAGAYEGLHDRAGDCYAYYATFTVLLQKCGIETIEVRRVGGESNHWWNLVNLGDGWYHCDSSPRKKGHTYKCFMQTDAQIQEYTDFYKEKPNYYAFDGSLYPERETTVIYDGNLN